MLQSLFLGLDGVFFGLFGCGQLAGFCFHVELVDAGLQAGEGFAIVGEDFRGLGIAGEAIDPLLVPVDELDELIHGIPRLLFNLRLMLDGLLKLRVELLLPLLDGGGRSCDGNGVGAPDSPGDDAGKCGKGSEDDGGDLHRVQFIAQPEGTY